MQAAAPDVVDLGKETDETRRLYGVGEKATDDLGRRLLLARRLAESDVRFVQVYSGNTGGWDAHRNVAKNHGVYCRRTDQPVAGLLKDLRRRGLLDDTLVIWGGEFGRTPMSEVRIAIGRDHHIEAFTMWLAGGGVKAGFSYGETDDIGYSVVENGVHVHDLHATILHLLGIDHEQLTYRFQGRDFRLTDVHGRVVHDILA